MVHNKKRTPYIYIGLAAVFLLLAGLLGFVATRPAPLSGIEKLMIGAWKSTDGFDQEVVFHVNRVVDVDMGAVRPTVVRWKVQGTELLIKEGRTEWDSLGAVEVDGNTLTIRGTKEPRVFVRTHE